MAQGRPRPTARPSQAQANPSVSVRTLPRQGVAKPAPKLKATPKAKADVAKARPKPGPKAKPAAQAQAEHLVKGRNGAKPRSDPWPEEFEEVEVLDDDVDEVISQAKAAAGRSKGKAPLQEKPKASWAKQNPQLPIQEKRHEVVPVLCGESPVVCLLGETGSGKSTQVPQMILQEARKERRRARICVTQPRRVAALNLANRVASELGERSTVGYRIGGESRPGEHIDYCTVGYTLQLFLNAPQELGEYTHIVLDEVHERSAESDMLCLVVRLLAHYRFPGTRIVVMSATLQSDLFSKYFGRISRLPVGNVFVGARCFPVKEYFLEDLPKALNRKLRCEQAIFGRIKDAFGEVRVKKIDQKHCDKLHGIVLELLEAIAQPDSTILVFLPGIAEISSLWQEAKGLEDRNFRCFPLHSMVPREEQELVFQEPEPGTTNVVLATDIAESSITLPHVVAVLDLGLHRRMDHDSSKGISSLATKWISKAAATQRKGRAGRTQPGLCLRLYTKQYFEKIMPDYEPPESTSMSLDRLYLQAKQLSQQLCGALQGEGVPRTAAELLMQMPEAPNMMKVGSARQRNAELGTISEATEAAKITALGHLCLQLPLDLKLTRLVWLGAHFGVASDAVVLASVLSSNDAFSMPSPLFMREESYFVDSLRSATSARLLFDGGELSEPLMQRQLFLEWLADFHKNQYVWGDKEKILWARRKHTMEFSNYYSLSRGRMDHMVAHVVDLSLRTYRACQPDSLAASSLAELLLGLGYVVRKGDLAGIPWKDWRAFRREEAFHKNTSFLKALLAAAFSEHLLVGGYGPVPKDLDGASSSKILHQLEDIQREMEKQSFHPRETVVFPTDAVEDPESYVEFVCGSQGKAVKTEPKEVYTLVNLSGLEGEATRWHPLNSRASAPLLVSKSRFPAEFNLLVQFEKHMRELQKARAGGWTHKPVPMVHPHLLKWEWMEPIYTTKGQPLRCEGVLEKKNPVGCVGYVQPLQKGRLRPVASFAVAANVRGGLSPTNAYPEGVTCLGPGHLAFVLSTAKLELTRKLRRFGFTTAGGLAVLHRCVDLPTGCLYGSVWAKVRHLRQALLDELQWEMRSKEVPVLYNSSVADIAWDLFQAIPTAPQEATLSEKDGVLDYLADATVNLLEVEPSAGQVHQAFLPVADWNTLVKRREELVKRLNRRTRSPAGSKKPTGPLPVERVARSSGPEKSSRKERSRSREKTRRRSRGAARPRERGDRERERGQRERSQRERSQRERSRRERSRPPQEPPARRPKVEVAACGLYELVMEVLRRWREASEDDVSDERFENAINVVHEQNVMSPKEQDRVAGELAAPRPRRRRGRNDRGPTAKSARSPWVPAALQELEKRNFRMIENLRAAALKNIVRIPEAVPEASGQEPSDAPEEVEAEEHMAPEEGDVNLEPEEGPDPDAEVPGLAPFTPSPEMMEIEGEIVDEAPGWLRCVDDEGKEFFYNEETQETAWELPV